MSLDPTCIRRIRLKREWTHDRLHLLYKSMDGTARDEVRDQEIRALEGLLHHGRQVSYRGIPVELLKQG